MNRHRFRARDYVEHMLDACIQIQTYIAGKTEADFLSDGLLQDGVVRRLEILGEASRQLRDVLPDAEARFPSIPFRTMYATRNQLIHGYIFVNYGVIWGVAHDEIPPMRASLEAILASWPSDLT